MSRHPSAAAAAISRSCGSGSMSSPGPSESGGAPAPGIPADEYARWDNVWKAGLQVGQVGAWLGSTVEEAGKSDVKTGGRTRQ